MNKVAASALLIILCTVLLLYSEREEFILPTYLDRLYASLLGKKQEEVTLIYGRTRFLIPKPYLQMIGKWNSEKQENSDSSLLISSADFSPKPRPYSAGGTVSSISVYLRREEPRVIKETANGQKKMSTKEFSQNIESRSDRTSQNDKFGLFGVRGIGIRGEPYLGLSDSGYSQMVDCTPDDASRGLGICEAYFLIGDVQVMYRFSKLELEHWKQIDNGVKTLIRGFERKQ